MNCRKLLLITTVIAGAGLTAPGTASAMPSLYSFTNPFGDEAAYGRIGTDAYDGSAWIIWERATQVGTCVAPVWQYVGPSNLTYDVEVRGGAGLDFLCEAEARNYCGYDMMPFERNGYWLSFDGRGGRDLIVVSDCNTTVLGNGDRVESRTPSCEYGPVFYGGAAASLFISEPPNENEVYVGGASGKDQAWDWNCKYRSASGLAKILCN